MIELKVNKPETPLAEFIEIYESLYLHGMSHQKVAEVTGKGLDQIELFARSAEALRREKPAKSIEEICRKAGNKMEADVIAAMFMRALCMDEKSLQREVESLEAARCTPKEAKNPGAKNYSTKS